MMSSINSSELASALQSDDLQAIIASLDMLTFTFHAVLVDLVNALETSNHRYFIAERLPNFGSAIIEPLEDLLQKSISQEAKVLASLVLVQLGSAKGQDVLLHEIKYGKDYACLAAYRLLRENPLIAESAILERLERSSANRSESELISCLLQLAASDFEDELPENLIQRFSRNTAPETIRIAVEYYKIMRSGGH